ncbi:MAG: 30S ribosomal protein S3 [Parcubacteria group bacterium Gr01-1014_33]|nr:MAG: 30S ribosomal protein S3 [Parcubacteria group bacterium Gr01-1014_33]
MTHRVHPYIFRIGQTRTWKSRWFAKKKFKQYLLEDTTIRELLEKNLRSAHIEALEIERFPHTVHVIIKTARPGILIGRGGEGAEKLKEDVQKSITKIWKRFSIAPEKREVKITIEEVRAPEAHASVAAQMIVEDIEKRLPFRRVMKQALEKISAAKDVKGVKIVLKGRLDGAEMARYEWLKKGRIPLQTLRADVDYAEKTCYTAYGTIGVKVWIYKGEVFEKEVGSRK